jgi:hypothetical protein
MTASVQFDEAILASKTLSFSKYAVGEEETSERDEGEAEAIHGKGHLLTPRRYFYTTSMAFRGAKTEE